MNSFNQVNATGKRKTFPRDLATAALALIALLPPQLPAQTPAFPEADGAGRYTSGGRGTVAVPTTVFEVTNLLDSNTPGTFRYACSQSAASRTIVFRVSGTIHLNSGLNIPANTTVAGQTASGDGICLADYQVGIGGTNVIIRYLRFRVGDKNQLVLDPSVTDTNCWPIWPPFTPTCKPYADNSGNSDCLTATDKRNLIVDHCSVSWSTDEALSLKNCPNTTIQWCIISEPLDYSYHYEGTEADYQEHGYGGIVGATNTSLHHNIYAHCKSRCPRFNDTNATTPAIRVDMRNNVIYNWRINTAYGGAGGEFNIVSNYYKAGPNTTTDRRIVGTETTARYFLKGNKMVGQDGVNGALSIQVTTNNWYGTSSGVGSAATLSMATPTLTNVALLFEHTADQTYDVVLAQAGATIPKRDSVDARIVNDVKNKTGAIIDVQGGYPHGTPYSTSSNAWPALFSTPAPTDTDHDGMPDFWEAAVGLNFNSSIDRTNRNADGYTMLEVYLNSLTVPPSAPTNFVASATNSSVTLTWSPSLLATNYNLKRALINGGPYTNIATLATTNYTDALVTNGTTYYYVVSAISAAGVGTNSAQVSATPTGTPTPPDAPLNLVANAGNASVALTWSSSATATNYNVKRSMTNGGTYSTIASGAGTSLTDTQVTNGATYFYVVSASNANGESTNSAQVSATPSAPVTDIVTTNVFTDTFGSSTVNGTSVPTTNSTGYDIASTKNASSAYSFITTSSRLRLSLSGATTSGFVEAQALFTTNPVTLATVGDCINLTYTFTNVSGTLLAGATNSLIVQGLFHSSGAVPVAGALANAGLNTTAGSTYATNNCAKWMGYVAQISNTNGWASKFFTRPLQNGAGTTSANQDLLLNSVGSGAFNNPVGTQIGSLETVNFLLTAGATYTVSYSISLTTVGIFTITNNLYSGTGITGPLVFSQTNTTTAGTYLTNSFDGLAIGVRNAGVGFNPTMDISKISVTAMLNVTTTNPPTPPAAPDNLTATPTNLLINLKWAAVVGATNFNLKRGTVSGIYPTIFSGLTTTNYADANVTNAVNYFYVVTALGEGGESSNSLPASAVPLPSNQPTNLVMQVAGNQLQLSWPQAHLGWRLQIQTNDLNQGISTNWTTVANSTNVNSANVNITPANGSVFLRLIYP